MGNCFYFCRMAMDETNIPDPKQAFVEQVNRKQWEAFHGLFEEFFQSLVIYAMNIVSTYEEAEDAIKDVFMDVWDREEDFVSYQNLRIFLHRSVKNTCLAALKRKAKKKKGIDDESLFPEIGGMDDYEWLEEAIRYEFDKVVDNLPTRCRQIFRMHLDGKKNEEIARELDFSMLTVKTQKKKAMCYVHEQMTHFLLGLLLLCESC